MPSGRPNPVLRYIRRVVPPEPGGRETDCQLLERFARQRDEAAFEVLVERHGPLVWSLCRRILHDPHDAEDAFQATFLVFVRKASAIGRGELLGNWLYGVAYRVAVRARANAAKRRVHEKQVEAVPLTDAPDVSAFSDLGPVLDEEVQRLPAKYRLPFVLCYLQGLTNEEAAREIGCPKGTILSRLARARERLRGRLTRRGIVVSTGGLTAALAASATPAAVPALVGEAAFRSGTLIAVGKATVAVAASAPVAALTKGMLQTMFTTKVITAGLMLLAASLIGTGAGVVSYRVANAQAADPDKEQAKPEAKQSDGRSDLVKVASPSEGRILLIGTDVKEGEKASPNQLVKVKVGDKIEKYRRLKKGDRVEEGQLLARLDDRLARDEAAIKERAIKAAQADFIAAAKLRDEYKARWDTTLRLREASKGTPSAVFEQDVRLVNVQYKKAYYETEYKSEIVKIAELELKKAQTVLKTYEIRSPTTGVIRAIAKHPGEAVKNLETVFVIRIEEK